MNKHLPGRHNQLSHGRSSLDDDIAALVKDHGLAPSQAKIWAGTWHQMGYNDLNGFYNELKKLPSVVASSVSFSIPIGLRFTLMNANGSAFDAFVYSSSADSISITGRGHTLLRRLPPKDAGAFLDKFEKMCQSRGIKTIHSTCRTVPIILAAKRGYKVSRLVSSDLPDSLAYDYLKEHYDLPPDNVAVGSMSIREGMTVKQVLDIPHKLFPDVSLFTEYLDQLDPGADEYVAISKDLV